MSYLVVLLFLQVSGFAFGQGAVVVPRSYTAPLGTADDILPLSCTAACVGIIGLRWEVDGQPADSTPILARGIVFTDLVQCTDVPAQCYKSNLTVPATFVNDNTTVQCFGVILNGNSNESNTVVLRIQGLLEEPPNLVITVLNETHRRLSWDPPFTLDITDQDPDIIAYTVCNNITGSCENTTETRFIFPNLAVQIEFSVTAINIVGEGNTSTVVHEACEPATELEAMGITVSFDGANPNVEIRFLQESACFHIYMVETVSSSSGIATMHGPLIPEVIYQDSMVHVIITLDSNLEENERHSATIIFVYEGGNTSLDSRINFTTFDIQSVEVAVEPGTIMVTLTFAAGSQALGFHLLIIPLSAETTQNISRNVTVEQTGSSPTLFDRRERGLDTGSYMVQIFDWESDGAIDFNNMVHCEQVTVTEIPGFPTPTSMPSPLPSTTPTDSSGPEADNSSYGVKGAVIGGLIIAVLVILIIFVGVWACRSCSARKKVVQNQVITDDSTGTGTQLPSAPSPLPPSPPYSLPGEDEPPDPMYEKAPLSRQGTPKRSRAFGHDSTDTGPHPPEEQHQPQPQLREMEPIASAMMVGENSQKSVPDAVTPMKGKSPGSCPVHPTARQENLQTAKT